MKRMLRKIAVAVLAVTALSTVIAAPARAEFGLHELGFTISKADGTPETRAGVHPYEISTSFQVNTFENSESVVLPDGQLKSLRVELPAGLVGNPTAVPRCPLANFNEIVENTYTTCPNSTAVGISGVSSELTPNPGVEKAFYYVPVYNLVPPPGSVAKLGFVVLGIPVVIDVRVNPQPPYNVVATVENASQAAFVYGATLSLWGNPANPAHDPLRGTCIESENGAPGKPPASRGNCPVAISEDPFLTLPRSCTGPLRTHFEARSWQSPAAPPFEATVATAPGMTGCSGLAFAASVESSPTTQSAETASGLYFNLDIQDEGLVTPEGTAQSDVQKAVVTLPEGMTVNPSAGNGLEGCSEEQLARVAPTSSPGEGCPEASKIGSVEVETPLLEGKVLHGALYVATQDTNLVHSMLAVYLVIKDPELGILVKLPGRLEADPITGRLTTTFGEAPYEVPQFPFGHLRFRFREGPRGPLVTPPSCGTYATETQFSPWSGGAPFSPPSSFEINSGIDGGACPSGMPSFHPGFLAGSTNNAAGAFSPFELRLTRQDGEQEITRFSSALPPGLLAKLAGVGRCSDAAISAAGAKSGREELANPSCPASSKVGRVLVGAGVGSTLTYVPGSIYLAGPFAGDPLSVVVITPGVAGPFDLGTVVIREALNVDPITAEAKVDGAASNPIPHILKGIPLRVRDVRAYIDRPDFTVNPTNCNPSATRATLFGSAADLFSPADDNSAGLSSRYQAASCSSLAFKPKLSLKLSGGTKRSDYPALRAELKAPAGDANIGRAAVTLPHSAFLAQEHIRTVCTRVQFAANQCPKGSVYGRARAFSPLLDEPLEGPVYLRSSSHPLPDLVVALHGLVDIDLIGRIDSQKGRIRTTFEGVPDAPVSKFVLSMQGGKKGLVVNSRSLCAAPSRAVALFTGQNGKLRELTPVVKPDCGKRKKHHQRSNR